MSSNQQQEESKDEISSNVAAPFEWLTSASSLGPILSQSNLFGDHESSSRRALHLGCGSSMLGDYLVQTLNYQEVVNVDNDAQVLKQMEQQWLSSVQREERDKRRMSFVHVDLSTETVPYPSGYFDLAVDKSTLDCTLCSDEATTGLLCQAYQSLKEGGGVYVVISFHHTDLLLPLLRDCPGAEWDVEHFAIQRQVEDLISSRRVDGHVSKSKEKPIQATTSHDVKDKTSVWSNGSFDPSSEHYRKWVNVMICRKHAVTNHDLDRNLVREHIHRTNDAWFQTSNPMVTATRQDELELLFTCKQLDLKACYENMFTDAEREHLTFEYFLEDWHAFLETHPDVPSDKMDLETAVMFLKEMQ